MAKADLLRPLLWSGIILILAYLLLVHWWWTGPMLEMGSEIKSLREEELTLRMEAAQKQELEKRLQEVRAFEAGNPGFLAEPNKDLATASLVQRLESVVQEASSNPAACQISARQPMDSQQREPYTRVTVQVRLRCGMTEFANVLYSLESGSPQLFADNIDISGSRRYLATNQSGGDGRVDIVFELYGYLKTPTGVKQRG